MTLWQPAWTLAWAVFILSHAAQAAKTPIAEHGTKGARNAEDIRVRIHAQQKSPFSIRGFNLRILENRRLAAATQLTSYWDLRCHKGRVLLQSRFQNLRENLEALLPKMSIPVKAPSQQGAITLALKGAVALKTGVGFIHLNGRPYRNEIRIYPDGDSCEVINVVDLERYVEGLINSEFNSQWDADAVAAQAVAARTYALYQMREARMRKKSQHFDVESTVMDQVYDGSLKEDLRAQAIVRRTRGLVMVADVQKAQPIKAFYHSTCGGETELPQQVWDRPYPGLNQRSKCTYCRNSPAFQWGMQMDREDLEAKLKEFLKVPASFSLADLKIKSTNESKRVVDLISYWKNQGKTILQKKISAIDLRRMMGVSTFKSTRFQVLHKNNTFFFSGRGNGHGVGMCQWGAKTMGEKGHSLKEILAHYYPKAGLRKLW